MALTKAQKQKILEDLKEKIAKQKAVVFFDFTGLKVKDLSSLRKKIKAAGSEIKIAKKTLFGLAFKEAGFALDSKKLKGETALVFGYKDEISPAKIVYQFSLENPNLKILGGLIESQKLLDAEQIIELAQLPSKEELLAKLVGVLSAPVSNLVYALNYNLRGLVYVLSRIKSES